MTRLLCAADLHLHEWPGLAPVDRLADQEHVLAQIAAAAVERDIDLVLLAGDIFHRPIPSPAVELVFQRFLRSLGSIPVIAVTGNSSHDIEAAARPCALELFESPTFRCSRNPEYITEFAGIAVATLPSVPVSNYVALVGGGDRDVINQRVADYLIRIADGLAVECRYTGKPTVLLGHWAVSGAAFPNGLPVDAAPEPVLDWGALDALGFDAVVLGHVHRGQILGGTDAGSTGFYTGSPMPLDHGETGFDHGVWILELSDEVFEGVEYEFVPLESRAFVTLAADITGDTETSGLAYVDVGQLWNEQAPEDAEHGAIVRVQIKATPDQWRRIDTKAIAHGLTESGAALVRFEPDIVRPDRARVEGLTEEIDELDSVRLWNTAQQIEPEHGEQLLALTAGYLEERTT